MFLGTLGHPMSVKLNIKLSASQFPNWPHLLLLRCSQWVQIFIHVSLLTAAQPSKSQQVFETVNDKTLQRTWISPGWKSIGFSIFPNPLSNRLNVSVPAKDILATPYAPHHLFALYVINVYLFIYLSVIVCLRHFCHKYYWKMWMHTGVHRPLIKPQHSQCVLTQGW